MKRLLLLALPLLLAACPARQAATDATPPPPPNAPTPPPAPQAPDLAAELPRFHWRLQDATDASGKRIDALFARAELPLQLEFRDGRIAVANTCNRMMGRYATSAGTLTVERLASTMMACVDPKLMALDREAGARLQGPLAMGLVAGDAPRLTLRNAAGDQLTFAGTPTPETRYGGPGERIFLEVAAQTARCSHPLIPDMQCLQVRELQYDDKGLKIGDPGPFGNFYATIEGYTHEPGVRNVLRVDRYEIKDPPADAPSQAFVLDMVVESDGRGSK